MMGIILAGFGIVALLAVIGHLVTRRRGIGGWHGRANSIDAPGPPHGNWNGVGGLGGGGEGGGDGGR